MYVCVCMYVYYAVLCMYYVMVSYAVQVHMYVCMYVCMYVTELSVVTLVMI
jgi:hypothetical protein